MKTGFKMVAKASNKVTITVQFESPRFELTRDEVRRKRENLKNRVHAVLRESGYDVGEIRMAKQ